MNKTGGLIKVIFVISNLDNYSDIICAVNEGVKFGRNYSFIILSKKPKNYFKIRNGCKISDKILWFCPQTKSDCNGFRFFYWAAYRSVKISKNHQVILFEVGSSIVTALARIINKFYNFNIKMYPYILSPTKNIAMDLVSGRKIFKNNWRNRWYYKRVLRQSILDLLGNYCADGFFVNAKHLVNNFTYRKNVFLLGNPINTANVMNSQQLNLMGQNVVNLYYAGRIEPAKGIEDLFAIISRCKLSFKINLKLIGDVDPFYKGWFDALIQNCEINVEHFCQMSRVCYLEKILQYDVLVFLSYYEGMPRVLDEAIALDKYVILRGQLNQNLNSDKILNLSHCNLEDGVDDFLVSVFDAKKAASFSKKSLSYGSNYSEFSREMIGHFQLICG